MRLTLVLPEALARTLSDAAAEHTEQGGFVLGRLVAEGDQMRFLARAYVPVPPEHYLLQAEDEMKVTSAGLVPALGLAQRRGDIALWFHTHPGHGSTPVPSGHDRVVDRELAETVRIRTDRTYYGTLIVSPAEGDWFTFSGYLDDGSGAIPFQRAWIVGDRLALIPAASFVPSASSPRYDRNVRAFGAGVQATLADLKVAVVGCGGTGSSVIEQLVRLGVRNFVLIDPKHLSSSNVTRVYGSGAADEGDIKVQIARSNILRIAPAAQVEAIEGDLLSSSTTRTLTGCDLVFGCTDDDAGRLVLSRVATYLICPVVDCGVLISSGPDDALVGIDGRITTLTPGAACLVCRGRIDTGRAATQFLPPPERDLRVAEGYAPALGGQEPAVVTFTTSVAAAAVNEVLERLIGYGPTPRPTEVLLRFHEREVSTNSRAPRPRHYCHPESGKLGLGDATPFLELTWPD